MSSSIVPDGGQKSDTASVDLAAVDGTAVDLSPADGTAVDLSPADGTAVDLGAVEVGSDLGVDQAPEGGTPDAPADTADSSVVDLADRADMNDAGEPIDHPPSEGGCPVAPPFDDTDPDIVSRCTRDVVVAVGNSLRRAVSYDGKTWPIDVSFPTSAADQNENSHRDVIVAKGLVIVVGDGGILVSFDGGATFTVANTAHFHDAGATFFHGAIWVVGSPGGTFSTTDGVNWTGWPMAMPLPGGLPGAFSAYSAATNGTRIVMKNGRDNRLRIFDGSTWTEQDLGAAWGGGASGAIRVVYGGGRFVILGQVDQPPYAGLRATSPDGLVWTMVTNASAGAATYRFGDHAWDGTRYFATATMYDRHVNVSPDGLVWQTMASDTAISNFAPFKGGYIGSQNSTIYRSGDGVAWTTTPTTATGYIVRFATGHVLKP